MYKEIIICISIILIIFSIDLIAKNYTKDATENLTERLQEIREGLVDENISKEKVTNLNKNIINEWKNKYEILAYYIEHDELEKVETELTSLQSNIEVEKFDDGIENLDRCIFILNHIKDKYGLKIKNIF